MNRTILAVLAALVLAGCGGTFQKQLHTAAASDLECPKDEVVVSRPVDGEPEEYVAEGCGRTAHYDMSCSRGLDRQDMTPCGDPGGDTYAQHNAPVFGPPPVDAPFLGTQ
jgi:hypothetical protein